MSRQDVPKRIKDLQEKEKKQVTIKPVYPSDNKIVFFQNLILTIVPIYTEFG